MTSHDELGTTFVATLSELLFGDEQERPLDDTLEDVLAPDFAQRVNGNVYDRRTYLDHVREMRDTVTGGRVETIEQIIADRRIAGRYLFRVNQADGSDAQFESHVFGEFSADGRIRRLCEVARVIGEDDHPDLIR